MDTSRSSRVSRRIWKGRSDEESFHARRDRRRIKPGIIRLQYIKAVLALHGTVLDGREDGHPHRTVCENALTHNEKASFTYVNVIRGLI